MPTSDEGDIQRELWLNEARRQGFSTQEVPKSYGTVYWVNGKKTNIKYSQVIGKRARFALGNTFLKKNEVFVFICENHQLFYSIKKEKMNWLANQTTKDASYGLPEFNLNIDSNEYFSGNRVFAILEHRGDWKVFL